MKITFVAADGTRRTIEEKVGGTLMEAARGVGIEEILAECGGAATCGTCHVFVDPLWEGRLQPLGEEEKEILEMVIERRPNSRLSCQIELTDALDGLVVETPTRQGVF